IALNLKKLPCEAVAIDVRPPVSAQRSAQYLAINPLGLVPALVDGAHVLTQSLAIIEYLEETHPQPPLLPPDAVSRARVRALALAIACEMAPLNNSGVLEYLKSGPLGAGESAVDAWYAKWIARGFEALEKQVSADGSDGRHMFGSSVTLADVALVPQMYNARRYRCDLGPYPRLQAISGHLESLPEFARAAPEAQPTG
ncbi:MAG TPA: maleylacetoacetate isomerase, partial [Steroidobacteraceae bacterium]|nr:maleylacetoacetate isomerase [Steroidobacteraceae bacterium]